MEFKGTPGNWFIDKEAEHVNEHGVIVNVISSSHTKEICDVYGDDYNAILISKAPEMLQNLHELTQILNGYIQEQANNNCFPNDIIQKVLKSEQLTKEATELKPE